MAKGTPPELADGLCTGGPGPARKRGGRDKGGGRTHNAARGRGGGGRAKKSLGKLVVCGLCGRNEKDRCEILSNLWHNKKPLRA